MFNGNDFNSTKQYGHAAYTYLLEEDEPNKDKDKNESKSGNTSVPNKPKNTITTWAGRLKDRTASPANQFRQEFSKWGEANRKAKSREIDSAKSSPLSIDSLKSAIWDYIKNAQENNEGPNPNMSTQNIRAEILSHLMEYKTLPPAELLVLLVELYKASLKYKDSNPDQPKILQRIIIGFPYNPAQTINSIGKVSADEQDEGIHNKTFLNYVRNALRIRARMLEPLGNLGYEKAQQIKSACVSLYNRSAESLCDVLRASWKERILTKPKKVSPEKITPEQVANVKTPEGAIWLVGRLRLEHQASQPGNEISSNEPLVDEQELTKEWLFDIYEILSENNEDDDNEAYNIWKDGVGEEWSNFSISEIRKPGVKSFLFKDTNKVSNAAARLLLLCMNWVMLERSKGSAKQREKEIKTDIRNRNFKRVIFGPMESTQNITFLQFITEENINTDKPKVPKCQKAFSFIDMAIKDNTGEINAQPKYNKRLEYIRDWLARIRPTDMLAGQIYDWIKIAIQEKETRKADAIFKSIDKMMRGGSYYNFNPAEIPSPDSGLSGVIDYLKNNWYTEDGEYVNREHIPLRTGGRLDFDGSDIDILANFGTPMSKNMMSAYILGPNDEKWPVEKITCYKEMSGNRTSRSLKRGVWLFIHETKNGTIGIYRGDLSNKIVTLGGGNYDDRGSWWDANTIQFPENIGVLILDAPSIPPGFMSGSSTLKYVQTGAKEIQSKAFSECPNLRSVELTNPNVKISSSAFLETPVENKVKRASI